MYNIEEFDKYKTKVLKYIIFKKRTVHEVKQKFYNEMNEDLLEYIIKDLQQKGYLDDKEYIERAFNEFKILRSLSKKELKYKLLSKGVESKLLNEYFEEHIDEINQYELDSAEEMFFKKQGIMDKSEIATFLEKKGYTFDIIKKVLDGGK